MNDDIKQAIDFLDENAMEHGAFELAGLVTAIAILIGSTKAKTVGECADAVSKCLVGRGWDIKSDKHLREACLSVVEKSDTVSSADIDYELSVDFSNDKRDRTYYRLFNKDAEEKVNE